MMKFRMCVEAKRKTQVTVQFKSEKQNKRIQFLPGNATLRFLVQAYM
jgi:hypothetical protein